MLLKSAINVDEILGGSGATAWCDVLRGMSSRLPVHLHFEPREIGSQGGPPVFQSTVNALQQIPELKEICSSGMDAHGNPRRARIKMRLSDKGKFIHRNRYQRRNVICCLHGEVTWIFINSAGGKADEILEAVSNDNWNGFRSNKFPRTLNVEEMNRVCGLIPDEVEKKIVTISAGDVMVFDGQWWHGTAYNCQVLNMFFTPGKDMEVAVSEHKRRMKMTMQKDLCVAVVNVAKCSKLDQNWKRSNTGEEMVYLESANEDEERSSASVVTDHTQITAT